MHNWPAISIGQHFSRKAKKKKKKNNWFCLALRQKAWGENIASKMMPRYPSCAENK
jgi:hypothetical protein